MSNGFTNELQCNQIAEMLYLELKRKNIPMAEDQDLLYSIIYSGAELIVYEGSCNDITEVVDRIKKYISDTCNNYPNYFVTGECS